MTIQNVVILGAGQAGGQAALALRKLGFDGPVTVVGEENYFPYERPPLSKAFISQGGLAIPELVTPDTYEKQNIALLLKRHGEIRLPERQIVFADGSSLPFDKLIITTGSRVRKLGTTGADLAGIHYLRGVDDARSITSHFSTCKQVLVVGGGWIGLEVAATARTLGLQVTVVETAPQLCARTLDPISGKFLENLHGGKGVDVRLGASVTAFEGLGKVERVVLNDGSVVSADCIVIGVGVLPNQEVAEKAGIAVSNGILVDEYCRTSVEGIYAAGDVTSHPNKFFGGRLRLETWENAQNQGIFAATSLLGQAKGPYSEVPWVWSDQYEFNIQLMGFMPSKNDVSVMRGDPASGSFVVAYLRNGRLWGAVAFNQSRELKILRKIMQAEKEVSLEQLNAPAAQLMALTK
ncbi:MAG: NAD(P)/FAD-dependent oxidoreductase [Steroidobacteraceae bacterium]